MRVRLLAFACGSILLAGCGSLPSAGPSERAVRTGASDEDFQNYMLVDIDARAVDELSGRRDLTLFDRFGDSSPAPNLNIGVGDTVEVVIYEIGPGGLFSSSMGAPVGGMTTAPTAGSSVAKLPPQVVARDGSITVPFAGRVHVAGSSIAAAQNAIQNRLAGKAMEPQVIITVIGSVSGGVAVLGEVNGGAMVPLTLRGDRILDVIAAAGGIKTPVHETSIQLTRGGTSARVPMRALLEDPRENIFALPGDVITVRQDSQVFIALGASGRNEEVPFGSETLTLARAVGKAGGLQTERADAEGVFIFRYEPAEIARALDPSNPLVELGRPVPVVYRLDMKDPKSLFVAQRFAILNGDVLYISDAPFADIRKALSLFQAVTTPVTIGNSFSR